MSSYANSVAGPRGCIAWIPTLIQIVRLTELLFCYVIYLFDYCLLFLKVCT